jgi:hypothetical protein
MGGRGRGDDDASQGVQNGEQPGKKKKKKGMFPGLGGLIPH